MTNIGKAISVLIAFVSQLGTLFLLFMMLHIALDVMLRYAFNSALPATMEVVINYHMIIVGFLSLSFTEEKNRNISVELIADMTPLWVQKHLDGFAHLVGIVVFSMLMVRNYSEALKKHEIEAYVYQGNITLPIWPAYYVIPIGCLLVLIVVTYKFACYLTGSVSGLNSELENPVTGEAK